MGLMKSIHPQFSHSPETYSWNDSLAGNYLWSNANFGEAVTEAMTPLTWSVIRFTLDDWLFLPGNPTVGNIGGFPYLNISIFATLFRMAGRNQDALLKYMEATLYIRLPGEMQIPLIPMSAGSVFSGLCNSIRVQNELRHGIKRLPSYLAENLEWFMQTRALIEDETTQTALALLWKDEIKPHIKGGRWTVLGTATSSSEYTLKLRRKLARLVGDDDASALISSLNDKADPLASLEPVLGIARVANGELSRAAYLQQFGHRGPHEFELSAPRPVEDPQWLDQELANFKASPIDVPAMLEKQQEEFEAAWLRLCTRYPHTSKRIRKEISESARRARLREQARSAYIRDRWLIRLFALRAAELTGIDEDIFYLYLEEIIGVLMGERHALEFIPSRRESYQQFKSLPPYPSVIRGCFDPFKWAADPQRSSDIFDEQEIYTSRKDQIIRGAAGSAGKVEGIVRRLDDASEGAALKTGEILVTTQTDISWTPLFPRLAAIVTDVGAPLSHAAIVARELGIPAVVGCGNATMLLKTGDRVMVDGGRGTVEILIG